MTRPRLRDLGITIGTYQPGPLNAITDVGGVCVGHQSVIHDEPSIARTGVTVVMPRGPDERDDMCFAGYHSFNGCGEMTGLLWIEESGTLSSPIALTNTSQVGTVRDAIIQYASGALGGYPWYLPVVAETWDGWLNDASAFPIRQEHVWAAIEQAAGGVVAEGNVGGGTGMICHDFKGGIGTSSRRVASPGGTYTVGALVQTNYGARSFLRIDGVPVGREIGPEHTPTPWAEAPSLSSIIVVLATDAPLLDTQCRRLARRATVGLARTGGVGYSFSGDIFLAFSTGNRLPRRAKGPIPVQTLPANQMDRLFEAAAEAVEESILNALTAAETMTGQKGRTVHALPLDELKRVMQEYRRPRS